MSRRRIFRVLAIYVAAGWGFTEIVQGVVGQVGGPPAVATFTTIAFIVGFPIVLFLAWMFDVDRHGVHRVPTRRKGQLVVSLSMAVLLSASYAIYRYVPRDEQPTAYQPPEDIVLAVVPFRNLSADDAYEFLGAAIAEDLLNGVAVIPELRVKATFSSFLLQGQEPAAFAENLGVNHLLDGTYRVQDENLRVSARLIDTETADVVWTRVLTDSISNVLQIEDQLAVDIASALGMVHPDSKRDTSRQVDPEVYRLYLQAREGMRNPWQDTEATMTKIQQVLELAPNFPEALSMMGFLQTGVAWMMEDRQSPWLMTGEEYALRALEIDPDLSEAHAVLALNYALQYRWDDARSTADRAIEVAGARPLNVIYTFPYNNLGHNSRSHEILLRVIDEDPLNPLATQNIISLYAQQEEDERALQWVQVAEQRELRYQKTDLIPVYARQGNLETARELAALVEQENQLPEGWGQYFLEAVQTGGSEELEAITDRQVAEGVLPVGHAIWDYMSAGADEDKVFAIVREAIPEGRFNQITLIHEAAARYRQDPRFVEIYTDLGLIEYWQSVELPDFCGSEQIEGLCP